MPVSNPAAIPAERIMSKALVVTRPEQSLAELELLLIEHRISGAPVVEKGRLVGVISRGDIPRVDVLTDSLDRMVEEELQMDSPVDGFEHPQQAAYHQFRDRVTNLTVRDAMSDQVVTCQAHTPAGEVAAEMVRHHIHRVIVVDGDRPIGVVSSLDIVKLIAE
jgi:CBS domain-containing protein